MKNRHFCLFSPIFVVFLSFLVSIQIFSVQDSHAQWVQTNGPEGGGVEFLAANDHSLFAGAIYGSIHRSTDHGNSWNLLSNGLDDLDLSALSANQSYIFAGSYARGIYRSSNNGESFIHLNNNLSSVNIFSLAVNGNNIYAGVNASGVYRSTNNGDNWIPANTGISDKVIYTLAVNGSKLYAATQKEIFYSSNNGENWSQIETLKGAYIHNIWTIGNNLLASITAEGKSPLIISSNNGQRWMQTTLTDSYIGSIAIKGQTAYASGMYGLYRSNNNGFNWIGISSQFNSMGITISKLTFVGNNLFAGSGFGKNSGIYRSTNDGVNWVRTSTGYNSNYVYTLAAKDNFLFVGTFGTIFRSSNNGQSWDTISNPIHNGFEDIGISKFLVDGNNLIAVTTWNIYRSTNNGSDWLFIGNELSEWSIRLAIVKENFIFITNANGEIFRSSNLGANWTKINNLNTDQIYTLEVLENQLWAGTSEGVFISTNNGDNWTSKGLTEKNISIIKSTGSFIFAGNSNELYRSSNNGINWVELNMLDNFNTVNLLVNGSYLFALGYGDKNIILSTNNGSTWINKSQGFANPLNTINCAIIHNNFIIAGTSAMSVWRRDIYDIIGIEQISGNVPENFVLKQNYPNPFNPVTNIEFSLPIAGNAKLEVYDITGKLVESLLNENLSTGSYNVTWNASNTASGIYFYKLTTKYFTQTKRMMLIK